MPIDLSAQYEQAFWRLALIMERMVGHHTLVFKPSQIHLFDQELNAWKASLPPTLNTDSPSFDYTASDVVTMHQAGKLCFDSNFMRVVLHWEFRERFDENSEDYVYSRDTLVDALRSISRCYLEIYRYYPKTATSTPNIPFLHRRYNVLTAEPLQRMAGWYTAHSRCV